MKKYLSHKRVTAGKIKNIEIGYFSEPDLHGGKLILEAEEGMDNEVIYVDKDYMEKHQPKRGGYFVRYEGGYESWSPADVFEDGYTEEGVIPPNVIFLTPEEIQSGTSRVVWAQGLIEQLPINHEGRNSWLMNYGDQSIEPTEGKPATPGPNGYDRLVAGQGTFSDALEVIMNGGRVFRNGWNGKGMFLFLSFDASSSNQHSNWDVIVLSPFITMQTADEKYTSWVASQADMLENDWVIIPIDAGDKWELEPTKPTFRKNEDGTWTVTGGTISHEDLETFFKPNN